MRSINKMKAMIALAVLGLGTVSIASADHGNSGARDQNATVRDRARLMGASIQGRTPEGNADFRSESGKSRQRLNVEVEHVNLPAGTVLNVTLTHAGVAAAIGHLTLSALGEGELELNSQEGATVPAVQAGDVVTVSQGTTAIATGVFN